MNNNIAIIVAGIGIVTSFQLLTAETETPVKLSSLPEAVQKSINATAGTGKIKSVATVVDGADTSYEVAVVNGKQKLEHKFSLDGKLLETEEQASLDTVPAAVKATILQHAGTHKILEVVLVTMDGKKLYEADIKDAKGTEEVKVSLTGEFIGSVLEAAAPAKDADGDNDGDEEKGK